MQRLFVILGQNSSMRKLVATSLMTFVVLLGSTGQSFALPPCPNQYYNNCFGTFNFTDGNKYVGEFRNGFPDGKGTFTSANGDKYVGDYKNGKKNGWGIYTFADGNKYVGEFRNGEQSGQGTMTFANGTKYVGEYRNGNPNGLGTLTSANGGKYVGEWKDRKFNGQGTYTFADGRTMEGIFKKGKFQFAQKASPSFSIVAAYKSGDYATALREWTHLAKKGDASAQYNLGNMYRRGQGVPQDYKAASKWYKLAAEQGDATAQSNLGVMYVKGEGVLQDNIYAHMWWNIAASSGNKDAAKYRDNVAKVMTSSQLEKAQNLARNYVPRKSSPVIAARKSPPSSKKTAPPKSGSTGSGFFVSKLGHIVTNAHVVKNCGSITVGDNAKKQVTVTLLETDKRNDLALLKISSTQMASADTKSLISKLGLKLVPTASEGLLRSDDVELGEDVLVSGYPYGDIYSNTIKVTKGIVSANRGIGDDTGQFQMDAAVQPGNSGGPIYDANGNIVGVVVAQLNKLKFAKAIGSLPENVNFGIKGSTVRQFLTSSGLPTKWSNRSHSMSTKELAKIAKNQTVMVVCRR
jgi:S1-C subfamily serine protease